jgi:class 3 adenylate cyclase
VSVPELPTGTVTFLITDLEGSTRLLRGLRERYGDVRAEHDGLLREAFEANGGPEGAGAREFPSARRTDIRCVGCR